MTSQEIYNRYQRQILLSEIGESGQELLLKAKVLVVGAGGLGCPALQYLVAVGVGTIGIVDFDTIEISNLQRQILFDSKDVGKLKAIVASEKLLAINPSTIVDTYLVRLDNKNALDIISKYDLVIDGTDNFETRYILNDACVLLDKPLIYGAVLRFEGQVAVFNYQSKSPNTKFNYRDLFPTPPEIGTHISCNDVGVLGVLPGIIGTMQATEAIKIITKIGRVLSSEVLTYSALTNDIVKFKWQSDLNAMTIMPKSHEEFLAFNYSSFCSSMSQENMIHSSEFSTYFLDVNYQLIDVRESFEKPIITEFKHINLPLSLLKINQDNLDQSKKIILFCKSGVRSNQAQQIIKEKLPLVSVFTLEGGIDAWKSSV